MKALHKALPLFLTLALLFALAGCSKDAGASSSVFPSAAGANLPEVLEMSVGTLGDTAYVAGITDADYNALLTATFQDVSSADKALLLARYHDAATGTDPDGALLYDWGRLMVTTDGNNITISAFFTK